MLMPSARGSAGQCKFQKAPAQHISHTACGKIFPTLADTHSSTLFKASEQVNLLNGDACRIGAFVIARVSEAPGETIVGRVEEILTVQGGANDEASKPDMMLLRTANVTRASEKYRMPHVDLQPTWRLFPLSVCHAVMHHILPVRLLLLISCLGLVVYRERPAQLCSSRLRGLRRSSHMPGASEDPSNQGPRGASNRTRRSAP